MTNSNLLLKIGELSRKEGWGKPRRISEILIYSNHCLWAEQIMSHLNMYYFEKMWMLFE